jgi:pSer/pThr/pTyr-binding forkhead associated (FHA) protein
MADETLPRPEGLEVVVQLLDASAGRPVKTWKFAGRERISIGRDDGQDVEISDPFVSRVHAELAWRGGEWLLLSRGRHGVLVENRAISELAVRGEVTFRLGVGGPTLRFTHAQNVDDGTQTLSYDALPQALLGVDRERLARDVREIADGDYFQNLQEETKRLRDRRDAK